LFSSDEVVHAVNRSNDSISEAIVATLTVRNLEEDVVRRLRIRAAEHGHSAEAEHRDILRSALAAEHPRVDRHQAAERLAEFRRRTAGRGSALGSELLEESRSQRMQSLTGSLESI
jgi:antitoxin FitA